MNICVHVDDERGDVSAPAWLWACVSEDETRFAICSPWSAGDWTYATDGRLLVRVPRLDGVPENKNAPKDLEREVLGFEQLPEVAEWWELMEIERAPVTSDCDECERASADRQPVMFGTMMLRNDLVIKAVGLPGARFAPEPNSKNANGRCLVKADGGVIALIMPINQKNNCQLPVNAVWRKDEVGNP